MACATSKSDPDAKKTDAPTPGAAGTVPTMCYDIELPANAPPNPPIPRRFALDSAATGRTVRDGNGAPVDSASWERSAEGQLVVTWRPQVHLRFQPAGGDAMMTWGDAAMGAKVTPCQGGASR
jgi:hypothetical protein